MAASLDPTTHRAPVGRWWACPTGGPYCHGIVTTDTQTVRHSRLPRVSARLYRRLSLVVVVSVLALIGTGAWVRLSESGLGCPTWPDCTGGHLVAHDTYHALVEFVNRCVITGVAVLVGLAVVGALLAVERRRDLLWLSLGLFAGYVLEAVLGGLTVLARLAPALVAAHLVVAMLLLADAVVLHWQAGRPAGPSAPTAGREVRRLGRLLLVVLGVILVLGTVVAGSGPYAGSAGVSRFAFHFQSVAELHAVVVLFYLGLVVAMYFALRADAVAPSLLRAYGVLLVVTALQGALGYAQYFSGLPVVLVEAHILGAGALVIATVRFNLALDTGVQRVGALVAP
jgi:cytochrome c oxidase assembly protein subunit 15